MYQAARPREGEAILDSSLISSLRGLIRFMWLAFRLTCATKAARQHPPNPTSLIIVQGVRLRNSTHFAAGGVPASKVYRF
jgi:hypothetical protein